jgi:hypothetical protein
VKRFALALLALSLLSANAQTITLVANLSTFSVYPATNRQVGYSHVGFYGPGAPQYVYSDTNGLATFTLNTNQLGVGILTVAFTPLQVGVLLTSNNVNAGPVDANSVSIALPAVATTPPGQQSWSTVASDSRYLLSTQTPALTNLVWGTDSNGIVPAGQVKLYLFKATPPFTTNNYTHFITFTN